MGEGFENKYQNVKVELGEINDDLDLPVPTPEELDAMIAGFGRSIAHPVEVAGAVESEEEKQRSKVTDIYNNIKKFNNNNDLQLIKIKALISQLDAIGSEPLLVHLKALVVDDEDLSKQEEFYKVSFIAINQLVHDYADKRKMKEVTKLVDEVDSSIAALK